MERTNDGFGKPDPPKGPPRFQFSLLTLLTITSAFAVVFALVRMGAVGGLIFFSCGIVLITFGVAGAIASQCNTRYPEFADAVNMAIAGMVLLIAGVLAIIESLAVHYK